jgi:FAD-dependent urate hydroxylase
MPSEDTLIIGAGPFGLSIAAHLRHRGIEHRIVGRPMNTWRAHMPTGMNLRSEPYGSDLAAPGTHYDIETYCRQHGLDYVARLGPLSLERLLEYTDWFADELVQEIEDLTVTEIIPDGTGFRVSFAEEESRTFRHVVVATGIIPYATLPVELEGLPRELVTHTCDHSDLGRFSGRQVAVVGGGQSALETAALLHESGADTTVVVRRPELNWLDPNPETLGPIGHLRRPVNKLCEGWRCEFWNTPFAFRRLPESVRLSKARTVLGPAGAWWLKDRIEGQVDVMTGHRTVGATANGGGVRLLVEGPQRSFLDVDHVIAGTGFRVDVTRLPFIAPSILSRLAVISGYPVLDRAGESSVSGLYFVGAPAAASNGPSTRFIAGTHTSVPQLVRSLQRGAGKPAALHEHEEVRLRGVAS